MNNIDVLESEINELTKLKFNAVLSRDKEKSLSTDKTLVEKQRQLEILLLEQKTDLDLLQYSKIRKRSQLIHDISLSSGQKQLYKKLHEVVMVGLNFKSKNSPSFFELNHSQDGTVSIHYNRNNWGSEEIKIKFSLSENFEIFTGSLMVIKAKKYTYNSVGRNPGIEPVEYKPADILNDILGGFMSHIT